MIFNEKRLYILKILKVFHFYLKGQTLIWFRSRTQKLVSLFLVLEKLPLLMPFACILAFFVPASIYIQKNWSKNAFLSSWCRPNRSKKTKTRAKWVKRKSSSHVNVCWTINQFNIRTEQLTYGMVCNLVDVGSFRLTKWTILDWRTIQKGGQTAGNWKFGKPRALKSTLVSV